MNKTVLVFGLLIAALLILFQLGKYQLIKGDISSEIVVSVAALADVDHVEPTAAHLASGSVAHGVREPRLLVDDDVVGAGDAAVDRRFLKGHRWSLDVPEPAKVEYLDAVVPGPVGHDEGVIGVDFDIAPEADGSQTRSGELAQVHRPLCGLAFAGEDAGAQTRPAQTLLVNSKSNG